MRQVHFRNARGLSAKHRDKRVCYHAAMERILDKTIVLAGCLLTAACFLVETGSGAELAASDARLLALAIAMLIAVLCSALTEAASMPAGVLALSAYCAAACFVPAALAFVPLALYDCARCIHRADVLRFSGALALVAIVACLMRATVPPLSTASLLCSAAAACILSVRTSTTLARQRIAWSTRDALASQALSLRKRNRSLRDSLDKMSAMTAQNDEETAIDSSTERTLDDSVSDECANNAALREQLRPAPFTCLTEREYEVARLVAEGLDNREIAATAYLSEGTVRNNISSILSKMELKNRTQIAVAYYKSKESLQ